MIYLKQFLHNFSNLILIRLKRIEANYFYVYQTYFLKKVNQMNFVFTFHSDMKPCDKKTSVTTQKNRMIYRLD